MHFILIDLIAKNVGIYWDDWDEGEGPCPTVFDDWHKLATRDATVPDMDNADHIWPKLEALITDDEFSRIDSRFTIEITRCNQTLAISEATLSKKIERSISASTSEFACTDASQVVNNIRDVVLKEGGTRDSYIADVAEQKAQEIANRRFTKVHMYSSYNRERDAGYATIYTNFFASSRARLRFYDAPRLPFSNIHARYSKGRRLFANTKAFFRGDRPIFANTRASLGNFFGLIGKPTLLFFNKELRNVHMEPRDTRQVQTSAPDEKTSLLARE